MTSATTIETAQQRKRDVFEQLRHFREDINRWRGEDGLAFSDYFEFGLWAAGIYRFSRFLFQFKNPVIKIPARIVVFVLFKLSEMFLGVRISPQTDIGPGLYIGHTGTVIIHPDACIGRNLSIGHDVTIAVKGVGYKGAPIIGDNVYIGTGARVLGNVHIGSNVRIGANAVVVKDIPDNATAVGVPAQVVKDRSPPQGE